MAAAKKKKPERKGAASHATKKPATTLKPKRKMSPKTVAPRPKRAKRISKPQSLLILHLDAEKLHADGLHLGDVASFSGVLSQEILGSHVIVEDATTKVHLNQILAKLALAEKTFDVVVVVAHSNANVIRVASDLVMGWPAFAGFLKPFKPRRLLLVACKGGRWDAGESLFQSMPLLRRIFACPVNASKDFGALMLFAVPYVVAERRPKDKHVWWSQLAAIATTGRQLREWRRSTDEGNPDSALFDVLADLADPIAREVPNALLSILKKVFGKRS